MLKKGFLEGKSFIVQLLALILITLTSALIIMLLSFSFGAMIWGVDFYLGLMGIEKNDIYYYSLFLLFFQHLGFFIIPAIIFIHGFLERPATFWGMDRFVPVLSLMIVFLILIFSQFPIAWLYELNKSITLPSSWAAIEEQFKSWEESAQETINLLSSYPGWEGWFFSFLLIAVLPALSEEIFFRGTLQTWLMRFTKSWVAIVLVAIVFSAFHFDFYGFLPRFVLGLLLGYIYYKTGSLWSTMFFHFLNNGLAFVFKRLYLLDYTNINLEDPSVFTFSWWLTFLFTLVTVILLYFFHQMKHSNEQ
ncbi:MAG: CPBP family intramembrane metalloprotease [Bacteroidales bacterium]|nr:CPBP family intramembrane metalloprotease [Bacteroidales bacterium]